MRTRRRLLLIIVAAVPLPLVGLGVFMLTPLRPGTTLENFRRLRPGMSMAHVEAILGSEGEYALPPNATNAFPPIDLNAGYVWHGDEGNAVVFFAPVCSTASSQAIGEKAVDGYFISPTSSSILKKMNTDDSYTTMLRRLVKEWTGW
jgi:hypothetical protein